MTLDGQSGRFPIHGMADLVFLLLDMDHFKSVNDSHGHAAGDAVLVQIAALLRSVFWASDPMVRWGGEEFLIVARFVDRTIGPELAEKVRAAVEAHDFRLDHGDSAETDVLHLNAWAAKVVP